MIDVLITYDVATTDPEGRRRLRQVANICCGYGQRVQLSTFECRISPSQLEIMRARLLDVIDVQSDSIRIYRLRTPRDRYVEVLGSDRFQDFSDPLVL
ncbi:CRISPR-associated protein Cas2 [Deinobacterium chartae]|uniref:CRISPR-associated endoribonuclease Cas2 n=1 Tax=Deinobacterium chartae TaxID=521158 RepID=A0A841HTD7_9DEIO|nr:CRISPR-associated endonuclease Cas2 [Deinobacterium chartae]MBB6096617.1 CRISPR-associated protein Cas2 [Deinobacterium chartae]